MQRISTPTAVNGKFIDGDLTVGRKATQFSASWCNALQEELCSVLEKFGIALDPSRNDQIAGIFGKVLTGSEDDNPQYLGQKLENIDGGVDASRNGDVAFREEDTRGGKVMAAFIKDGHLKPSHVSQDESDEFNFRKINVTTEATFGKAQFSNPDVGSTNLTGLYAVEAYVMDATSIGVDVEEVTDTTALHNTNGKKKGRIKLLFNSTENAVHVYYRQGSQFQYAVTLDPGHSRLFVYLQEDADHAGDYIWSPID